MKVKQEKSRYILLVGLLSLIIAGAILAYQLYAALIKTQISKEEKLSIKPIDGSIKQEVIQNLRQRRHFLMSEINTPLEGSIAAPSPISSRSSLPVIDIPPVSTAEIEATQ